MLKYLRNGYLIKSVLSLMSAMTFFLPSNYVAAQTYYNSDCCEDPCCPDGGSNKALWVVGGSALLGAAAGAIAGYAAGRNNKHHHHSGGCGGCSDDCGVRCPCVDDSDQTLTFAITVTPSTIIPVGTTYTFTTQVIGRQCVREGCDCCNTCEREFIYPTTPSTTTVTGTGGAVAPITLNPITIAAAANAAPIHGAFYTVLIHVTSNLPFPATTTFRADVNVTSSNSTTKVTSLTSGAVTPGSTDFYIEVPFENP